MDLRFSAGFHSGWIANMRYNVRFGINRSVFGFMQVSQVCWMLQNAMLKEILWVLRHHFRPLVPPQDALRRCAAAGGPHPATILPSLFLGQTRHNPPAQQPVSVASGDSRSFPNAEQQVAISTILAPTTSPLPYVVFGPPGTGKTSTVVEAIVQARRQQAVVGGRVCTHSRPMTQGQ